MDDKLETINEGDNVMVKTSVGWWPGYITNVRANGIIEIHLDAVEGRRVPPESNYGRGYRKRYYLARNSSIKPLQGGRVVF